MIRLGSRPRLSRRLALGALLLALAVGALSASAVASPSGAAGAMHAKANTTLVVWDAFARDPRKSLIDRFNAEFEKAHPGVHIDRVTKEFNDYNATVKLVLSASNPPDVVTGNQGWSADGIMVKAGLLAPLDTYDQKYGWSKRFGNLNELKWSADGKTWGSGHLYGVSYSSSINGVFYNKANMRKLGIGIPKTFAEFTADLAKAKAAGMTPIQLGDEDKWPGTQNFQMLQDLYSSPTVLRNWIYGKGNVNFSSAANMKAAALLTQWSKDGYITPGSIGIPYDSANANFAAGQGLFDYSGTWLTGLFAQKMKNNVGFFLVPPAKAGQVPLAVGSLELPWHISARSTHKDLAAAYIAFIMSKQNAAAVLKSGEIPVNPVSTKNVTPVIADTLRAWKLVTSHDKLVPFLDWATPDMLLTVGGATQGLLGAQSTPKQFVDTVQSHYSAFQKTKP
jgi:raffinose/stachyose/melibiose transport system substrate-binding protein